MLAAAVLMSYIISSWMLLDLAAGSESRRRAVVCYYGNLAQFSKGWIEHSRMHSHCIAHKQESRLLDLRGTSSLFSCRAIQNFWVIFLRKERCSNSMFRKPRCKKWLHVIIFYFWWGKVQTLSAKDGSALRHFIDQSVRDSAFYNIVQTLRKFAARLLLLLLW